MARDPLELKTDAPNAHAKKTKRDGKAVSLTKLRSLARCHTEQAISVLGGILSSEDIDPKVRIAAAKELLDRGWGKPGAGEAQKTEQGQGVTLIRRVIIHSDGNKPIEVEGEYETLNKENEDEYDAQ